MRAASLVVNNTIENGKEDTENKKIKPKSRLKDLDDFKDDDIDDKSEKEHLNYGHLDDALTESAPVFKHPLKLYKMDMKPAGNSARLRCAAEG